MNLRPGRVLRYGSRKVGGGLGTIAPLPIRHAFSGANMHHLHACSNPTPEALYPFDARGIAKRFRHAAIFGALDALQVGETMRFCNDHDPLPLLAQLQQRYGAHLDIEYKQREPGAIVIDFKVVG